MRSDYGFSDAEDYCKREVPRQDLRCMESWNGRTFVICAFLACTFSRRAVLAHYTLPDGN